MGSERVLAVQVEESACILLLHYSDKKRLFIGMTFGLYVIVYLHTDLGLSNFPLEKLFLSLLLVVFSFMCPGPTGRGKLLG